MTTKSVKEMTNEECEEQRDKMKPGVKVKRGRDWCYGDSDGGPDAWGVVVATSKMYDNEYVAVDWNNGNHSTYRMYAGQYHLQLTDQNRSRRWSNTMHKIVKLNVKWANVKD